MKRHKHPKRHKLLWRLTFALTLALLPAACDYARMTRDEAYDTYETRLPIMPPDSISVTGGMTALRMLGPRAINNPLQPSPAVINQGRATYGYFCIHCHGPEGEGKATVGQSFAPLPTNLQSSAVQNQTDGELFYKIGFGYQRHPPLIHTATEADIWAVIIHMRQMKGS
jgi:mono/diheme cytochrome c family protein